MTTALPRVHAVTDTRVARLPDLAVRARALAEAGARVAFHARGPELTGREHFDLARELGRHAGTPLIVNDRLDVALAVGARGVQLGARSLAPENARRLEPRWWIGVSVHDLREAEAARLAGADYLVIGPVFATVTHPGRPALGLDGFAEIAALGLPAVAIGGVTPDRGAALRAAGAHGVAAIRALWDADDPGDAARNLLNAFAE